MIWIARVLYGIFGRGLHRVLIQILARLCKCTGWNKCIRFMISAWGFELWIKALVCVFSSKF